jgi:hypothetical protein
VWASSTAAATAGRHPLAQPAAVADARCRPPPPSPTAVAYQESSMKRLTPSTKGEAAFVVRRERGPSIVVPEHYAKFMSVREEANALLKEHDTLANPVLTITITYTFGPGRTYR